MYKQDESVGWTIYVSTEGVKGKLKVILLMFPSIYWQISQGKKKSISIWLLFVVYSHFPDELVMIFKTANKLNVFALILQGWKVNCAFFNREWEWYFYNVHPLECPVSMPP